jgi:hypothetical protein
VGCGTGGDRPVGVDVVGELGAYLRLDHPPVDRFEGDGGRLAGQTRRGDFAGEN